MFGNRKRNFSTEIYDKDNEFPVLKCSICTGERVAGFQNKNTGKFRELMVIRNDAELEEFKKMVGRGEIRKIY